MKAKFKVFVFLGLIALFSLYSFIFLNLVNYEYNPKKESQKSKSKYGIALLENDY